MAREIQTQRRRVTWDGTQRRYGTPIQHRGTEIQREELNIELKKIIIFEFYVQFFPLYFCASVPLCLCVEWAFHSDFV
jgi:hypothetical protein